MADMSRQCTLALALEDPLSLYALLCTVSGALYSTTGDTRHGIKFMQFKEQSLQALKSTLSSNSNRPIPVSSIYGIANLLWVEVSF